MERIGRAPLRVLVVDDEPDGRYLLARLLDKLDCETAECGDGPSCLELVRRLRPDLVLLDLAMPGMDGFQVLDRLEELDDGPRVVVALSGFGDKEIVARCRAAGFHSHELKPISFARLQQLVAEARPLAREPIASSGVIAL
ncbi:MAG TPA: response regulator [Pirellulales bacterium]|nr:response regulator [Pirellulales bacterium]